MPSACARPFRAFILGPLLWVSDRVFLRLGDRTLFDGTLHTLAAMSRGTAGLLARLQTGNLHFYAFLVLAGLAGALYLGLRHV